MQWRSGKDLRELFLDYFEENGHRRFPSFSLVPDDPSLLFTIAGMVPFKPFFLGMRAPLFKRATTAQKCVRTNDIDNVGRTARHHTLFEMLGNFSFGDYFKSGAASFAWTFLTEKVGLDPDRLFPTIYKDDDEAFDIWNREMGVPEKRIYRLGEEDNFWSVGPVGPCGPCSEIIYDQGPEFSCGKTGCDVGCDCDRYLEIWNLVFMQYNRLDDGTLEPLPSQNIDTGMGLERLASVVQQVSGDFQTDLFKPLVDRSCEICGINYGRDGAGDMAARVISDHFRATAFMIADGILPSNEGRGYVLRRILRRAVRFGRLCGIEKPFLMGLYPTLLEVMGEPYAELAEQRPLIEQVIEMEEARFGRTLEQGLRLLEAEIRSLQVNRGKSLKGDVVFELYDTFGFPYELTEEVCQEQGVSVDRETFDSEMEKQKKRARAGARNSQMQTGGTVYDKIREASGSTVFSGYVNDSIKTSVAAIVFGEDRSKRASKGSEVMIILPETPFYAEGGGQTGDRGTISGESFQAEVLDTLRYSGDLTLHKAVVVEGEVEEGAPVVAQVDVDRRRSVKSHHSATHLLHESLGRVLGCHVSQAGSLVTENFLRFDFTHIKPMNRNEIEEVETIVNRQILLNTPLEVMLTDIATAKALGARALFDEKYGENVRVIKIPGFSTELCGGTHVDATGDIGSFKIIREEGIGSGVRRITALCGMPSFEHYRSISGILSGIEAILSVPQDKAENRIAEILEENRMLEAELEKARSKAAISKVEDLVAGMISVGRISLVTGQLRDTPPDSARIVGDRIKQKLSCVAVVMFLLNSGGAQVIAMADKCAVDLGVDCGKIVKTVAGELGGGGGGRPDLAQAGIRDISGVESVIRKMPQLINLMVGSVN